VVSPAQWRRDQRYCACLGHTIVCPARTAPPRCFRPPVNTPQRAANPLPWPKAISSAGLVVCTLPGVSVARSSACCALPLAACPHIPLRAPHLLCSSPRSQWASQFVPTPLAAALALQFPIPGTRTATSVVYTRLHA